MPAHPLEQRVAAVRRFNRFYTAKIGVLQEHLLKSPFSLTEARVVYELAQRGRATATALGAELGLDGGYVSRLVQGFRRRGLLTSRTSPADRRQSLLSLTPRGRRAFARLDAASKRDVTSLLHRVPAAEQDRLVRAMGTIEGLLGERNEPREPYVLRPPRTGDLGWVVWRHGELYAVEYGWDERFEGLVAGIVARFVERFDPKTERCWIAERDGENVGCVFLVKRSRTVAQLRMLLVEPRARGLGIGKRLVDECTRFAKQTGYRKIVLWTNNVLLAARHLYVEAGYKLVKREPHHEFGRGLIGETWELDLKR